LLIPMVITAVLSMLQALAAEQTGRAGGLDVFCMLFAVLVWLGAAVLTKTRLFGRPMPKTGLTLAGMLLLSVLFYVLAFAMEQEVIGFSPVIWAMGRLFGAPAAVSADGVQVLLDTETGTAAMLSCGVYLAVSFAAALPVRAGSAGKAGKRKQAEK
ncbi:MAG: hypothetical protein IJX14_08705, partial [Clostridia bacterium]|nr:hypothetical protein [Clostridia bacterium]